MQLSKNPKRFALWQGADNLQNLRFPDLGIPCPFMLSWTTELEEQTATQNEALRKDMDLSKKANSAYGQLFPARNAVPRSGGATVSSCPIMRSRFAAPIST